MSNLPEKWVAILLAGVTEWEGPLSEHADVVGVDPKPLRALAVGDEVRWGEYTVRRTPDRPWGHGLWGVARAVH